MKIVIDTAVDKIDKAILAALVKSLAVEPAEVVVPVEAAVVAEVSGEPVGVVVNPACSAAEEVIVTQQVKEAVKKKRKRRTKAQIIADKRKEEEAIIAKAAAESVDDGDVTAEKVVESPPTQSVPEPVVAPLPATVDIETVKQEVVDAIGRLNAKPADPLAETAPPSATVQVVTVLEEVTGKKRVGEIAPDQYGAVLAALKNVGV